VTNLQAMFGISPFPIDPNFMAEGGKSLTKNHIWQDEQGLIAGSRFLHGRRLFSILVCERNNPGEVVHFLRKVGRYLLMSLFGIIDIPEKNPSRSAVLDPKTRSGRSRR
jgi:hypothetical protein